jgi:secondary thiamine-phosphate synthase enzyme
MIEIATNKQIDVIDLTPRIEKALQNSALESGICLVYSLHTTTGIIINEAESGLIQDLAIFMAKMVPKDAGYEHNKIDSNAHSHLRAVLTGNSVVVPVENGRLALGTWQKILFLEFDGPRRRRISVKMISG